MATDDETTANAPLAGAGARTRFTSPDCGGVLFERHEEDVIEGAAKPRAVAEA